MTTRRSTAILAGRLPDSLAAGLATRLATDGYAVAEGYLDPALCAELERETSALATAPDAIDAGIGRGGGAAADLNIRRARIRWLDGTSDAQSLFLAHAEALRLGLNRTLFLGLQSFEAQLALTPAGGFYGRHLDSFQGSRNRIVSLVVYLNTDWLAADGGCLRLWPAHGPVVDVVPAAATMVMMLSEEVPHEVLPSHRARAAIAGWFSLSPPRAAIIDAPSRSRTHR